MAINLLPKNLQSAQRSNSIRVVTNAVSFIFLVLILSVVIILMSYRFTVTREYNDIVKRYDDYKKQVDNYKDAEVYLTNVKNKVNVAKSFIDTQSPYGDIVEDLQLNAGDQIQLNNIALDKDVNITIDGSADDLASLARFYKLLNKDGSNYIQVSLNRLSFDSREYNYTFALSMMYQKIE